jgi:hypothetical protein
MKAYWESGGTVPRSLDFGTRWMWVVSFTPPFPSPPGKGLPVPIGSGGLVGLDAVVRKIPNLYRDSNQLDPFFFFRNISRNYTKFKRLFRHKVWAGACRDNWSLSETKRPWVVPCHYWFQSCKCRYNKVWNLILWLWKCAIKPVIWSAWFSQRHLHSTELLRLESNVKKESSSGRNVALAVELGPNFRWVYFVTTILNDVISTVQITMRRMEGLRGCIQKFPDWVNNKHSLKGSTKGYGGKTHYTDSQNSDITAPSGRELYHLQFSLQAASPETFGYALVG